MSPSPQHAPRRSDLLAGLVSSSPAPRLPLAPTTPQSDWHRLCIAPAPPPPPPAAAAATAAAAAAPRPSFDSPAPAQRTPARRIPGPAGALPPRASDRAAGRPTGHCAETRGATVAVAAAAAAAGAAGAGDMDGAVSEFDKARFAPLH